MLWAGGGRQACASQATYRSGMGMAACYNTSMYWGRKAMPFAPVRVLAARHLALRGGEHNALALLHGLPGAGQVPAHAALQGHVAMGSGRVRKCNISI